MQAVVNGPYWIYYVAIGNTLPMRKLAEEALDAAVAPSRPTGVSIAHGKPGALPPPAPGAVEGKLTCSDAERA